MKKTPFNYKSAVQWHLFDKESANHAALMWYADGTYKTWKEFLSHLYSDDCKEIVTRLRGSGMGLDFWRDRAKAALRRM